MFSYSIPEKYCQHTKGQGETLNGAFLHAGWHCFQPAFLLWFSSETRGVVHSDMGKYSLWLSVGDHLPVDRTRWTVVWQSTWADIGLPHTTEGPHGLSWEPWGRVEFVNYFQRLRRKLPIYSRAAREELSCFLTQTILFSLASQKKKKKKPSFKYVLKVKFFFCCCCFWEKITVAPWPISTVNYPIVFLKHSILKPCCGKEIWSCREGLEQTGEKVEEGRRFVPLKACKTNNSTIREEQTLPVASSYLPLYGLQPGTCLSRTQLPRL